MVESGGAAETGGTGHVGHLHVCSCEKVTGILQAAVAHEISYRIIVAALCKGIAHLYGSKTIAAADRLPVELRVEVKPLLPDVIIEVLE